jgi:hypothetical protein
MNVSCFRFPFERTLKHFLSRDILAAIQFNHAAIIQRVGIPRKHVFCTQARFSNRKVRTSTCGNFGNLRILFEQSAKLVASFSKVPVRKFFMGMFEREQRRRFINGWRTPRRRRRNIGALCADGSKLLSLFDSRD